MRKVIACIIFMVLRFNSIEAQNLVYDGSFEDTIMCPQMFNSSLKNILEYWKKSGNISGVALNTCNADKWGVPQNFEGYENAHSGIGYICLPTFGDISTHSDFRQFAIGQLKQTLVAGKKYKVAMFVSLADSFIYACNNISIYFSDTIPTYSFYDVYKVHFNFTHPVDVNFHQDLNNKAGWTKLDTTFIASGNERWLTIGNFLPDSLSDTNFVGGNLPQTNYAWDYGQYYIDDVSVELNDDTGLEENGNAISIAILPNPNNGSFTIKADAFNKPTTFVITDALGQVIDIVTLTGSSTKYDNRNLPNGMYFCTTISNILVTSRGKFLIQK